MSLRKTGLRVGELQQPFAASMRPQRVAAENIERRLSAMPVVIASMRPQRVAAENSWSPRSTWPPRSSFHEAAACRCGKRRFAGAANCSAGDRFHEAAACRCGKPLAGSAPCARALAASMRPQRVAAENTRYSAGGIDRCRCFHEAAACRCGKHHLAHDAELSRVRASMRPQRVAAENTFNPSRLQLIYETLP